MPLHALQDLRPPPLTYRGIWRCVQVEPIPGSGERITCCVASVGQDGSYRVDRTITPKVARCLYGDVGERLMGQVDLIVESLEAHLESGRGLPEWRSPLSGFLAGEPRDTVAENLQGIARQAVMGAASLGDPDLAEEPESVAVRFRTAVRNALIEIDSGYRSCINREVKLAGLKRPKRYGFAHGGYYANYTAISPTAASWNSAMTQIVDLLDLVTDKLTIADKVELLVAPPIGFLDDPGIDKALRQTQREYMEDAVREAGRLGVHASIQASPQLVARHIHAAMMRA